MRQSPTVQPMTPQNRTATPDRGPERLERIKQEVEDAPPQYITSRDMRDSQSMGMVHQEANKAWGYAGLDLMNSGAASAFWQNYSGKVDFRERRRILSDYHSV